MNVGLGHEFLRHIERTKVLLYVLDVAGTEGRDPVDDFQKLQTELLHYNPELLERPALIFANKIDRKPKTTERNLERLSEETELAIVSGSIMKKKNLDTLVESLRSLMQLS